MRSYPKISLSALCIEWAYARTNQEEKQAIIQRITLYLINTRCRKICCKMGNIPGTEFKEYALENDLDEVEALLADHPDLLKWVDEVYRREVFHCILFLLILYFSCRMERLFL